MKTKLSDIKLMWQCGPPKVDVGFRFSDGCPEATGASARSPAAARPTTILRILFPPLGLAVLSASTGGDKQRFLSPTG
jgi:hypothetical protein